MTEFRNLTDKRVEPEFVEGAVRVVLEGEKQEGEISVVFVGKREMKELNRRHRSKNTATDVLSFNLEDEKMPDSLLGEVVVCPSVVKGRFKEQGLARVVVHGVLHILGYEHGDPSSLKEMRRKEDLYLRQLFGKGF